MNSYHVILIMIAIGSMNILSGGDKPVTFGEVTDGIMLCLQCLCFKITSENPSTDHRGWSPKTISEVVLRADPIITRLSSYFLEACSSVARYSIGHSKLWNQVILTVVWRNSAVEEISRDLLNPLPILVGPFPYSLLVLACF